MSTRPRSLCTDTLRPSTEESKPEGVVTSSSTWSVTRPALPGTDAKSITLHKAGCLICVLQDRDTCSHLTRWSRGTRENIAANKSSGSSQKLGAGASRGSPF